jgi:hypothetical protein
MSLSDAELLVAAIFKVPSATAKRMLAPAGDSPRDETYQAVRKNFGLAARPPK